MELVKPIQVSLDNASLALIEDVGEAARRVKEHRPLSPSVVHRIEDDLLGERVYSSNAIEGNTLDLRETVMILKSGVIGAQKRREALEARNLGEAARRIFDWSQSREICHTPDRLCEAHGMILREIDDEWAGRFRGPGVMIAGAKHQPPRESLVPDLVQETMEVLNRVSSPGVLEAVWAHWAIARIHPFQDGNGRIARLWQDLILYRAGLTFAIIRPADRTVYLDALGAADDGDFNPLVQLVAHRICITFDKYFAAIREEQEHDQFISDLVGEADARADDRRKLSYIRWSRKMEQLRREFETCASRITEASRDIKVQVRPYELIDQTGWENIRGHDRVGRTWFFVIDFFSGQQRRRYFFFFGFHYWTDGLDNDRDRSEQRVCLLVSEDDGTGQGVTLDKVKNCPITLREVFVAENAFVRKRFDPVSNGDAYDRDISALRIAQDFFREAVLGRLT